MDKTVARAVLRERLGEDATKALTEYVEVSGDEWRGRVLEVCGERVEGRMHLYADRNEVVDGFARIATQMAEMKVDILRWTFAFWVGQVVVTVAIVALFARLIS
jgi:formylmethanofuran:tetrahydromethanopterin formyltransferase